MYGWRARVGYVAMSPLEVQTYEFWRAAPDGVVLVSTGLHVDHQTTDELTTAEEELPVALGALVKFDLDLVVVGGAMLAFERGPGSVRDLASELAGSCRAPVVLDVEAMTGALEYLGVRTLSLVSPYGPRLSAAAVRYFEGADFEVAHLESAGISSSSAMRSAPSDLPYELGARALRAADAAEALVICGDEWPALSSVQRLEDEFGVPVVCHTQAVLWHTLRHLHISERVSGFGRLLAGVTPGGRTEQGAVSVRGPAGVLA